MMLLGKKNSSIAEKENENTERVFFRWRDLSVLLLLGTIVLVLCHLVKPEFSARVPEAQVFFRGRKIDTILLEGIERDYTYTENPHIRIHQFSNGTIAFTASDCPDKRCIKTGKIGRPGAFSACVPNHFLIVIKKADSSESTEEVDIVA